MPRRVCYVCWYRFRRLVLGTDDRELYCYFEFENDGWFSDVFEACPRFRSSRDESIDLKAQHAFDFDFWQYRNQQQTTKIICRWSYRVFAIVGLFFWTLKEITVQNETCRIEYRADTVRQVTRVGIVRAHTFYTKKCSRTKRKKKNNVAKSVRIGSLSIGCCYYYFELESNDKSFEKRFRAKLCILLSFMFCSLWKFKLHTHSEQSDDKRFSKRCWNIILRNITRGKTSRGTNISPEFKNPQKHCAHSNWKKR